MATVNISKKERIGSALAGGVLIGVGIVFFKKLPVQSIINIIGGGLIIARGASGHCPVNEAIGRNTAEVDDAVIEEDGTAPVPPKKHNHLTNYFTKKAVHN